MRRLRLAMVYGHYGEGMLTDLPTVVRTALPSDADVVGELTERVYRTEGFLDVEGGDRYAIELRDAERRIALADVLVAERAGGVVGGVTLARYGTPYAEIAVPGELEVRMLAVDPSARRSGVAAALMAATFDHAVAHGCQAVVLSTEPPMVAAHRLYEGLGFSRAPDRDWGIDGFELWVFRRSL